MTATVADLLALSMDAGHPAGDPVPPEAIREAPEHRALLVAARAGSREAFGELVALHERVVFRAALAALGSREDAEEAAQDAFVVAWQKLPGFRGESSFRTWLLTITWRKALDRRRSLRFWRTRRVGGCFDANEDLLSTIPGAGPDPERAALAGDLARQIRKEIAALTPKLRDTLLLAASGEHSYQEIATLLNAPVGTVKWRVSEARRLVADRIGTMRAPQNGTGS